MTYWNDDEIKHEAKERRALINSTVPFWIFFRYAKSRLFVTAYTVILSFLFIDLFGLKYWQFAVWFVPLNFMANFFIYKRAFRGKKDVYKQEKHTE